MLIKVDMQAQFDQQSLFDIMNDTLGSGTLGQYQVDPRSIALKGEFSLISLFLPLGGMQHGRVVRALNMQVRGPEFKSRCDH